MSGPQINDPQEKHPLEKAPCAKCARYVAFLRCLAFAEIPEEIFSGENKHKEPFPGDGGLQFLPKGETK